MKVESPWVVVGSGEGKTFVENVGWERWRGRVAVACACVVRKASSCRILVERGCCIVFTVGNEVGPNCNAIRSRGSIVMQ